jgi:cell division protein FtsB
VTAAVLAPPAAPLSARWRTLVALGAVLGLALLAIGGFKSHQDLAAARAREGALRERIAVTEASVAALRQRIERLRDDPVMLERLAREELGWIRPGDVVVVFPEAPR